MPDSNVKVLSSHLQRDAYLYVRQSTIRQVFENTESTKRQYALRNKAVALGWSIEQIQVIDSDLGRSGAERDRSGFQELESQVSMGKAGIVMGLEVSRLARNSMDWHRLLEICALTNTLILDEDGVYDPAHFNDRLLLGLKGTMSEAEPHVMRARLYGGMINKARRGELRIQLPLGLVYDIDHKVIRDPDKRIQDALRYVFATFSRLGSACATVKEFREKEFKFPRQPHSGPHKGELFWGTLQHSAVLRILHNPRYAGAFVYGRRKSCKDINGKTNIQNVSQDQWEVILRDEHEGYITWESFETNQRRLLENAQANGQDRRSSAPREGPALLQGLVLCGKCGGQMTVRYKSLKNQLTPIYVCQRKGIEAAKQICQFVVGQTIDEAAGKMLLGAMTLMNLDVSIAVEQEMQIRRQEAESLRMQSVEQARYEADLAKRRFMRVDPDNRLVADSLEGDWNEKLRELHQVQKIYEKDCEKYRSVLSEKKRSEIRRLADDFPSIWNSPNTQHREKKRLLRLLIEDVTLLKKAEVQLHVRFNFNAHENGPTSAH
jgi:DNA invertase Pin-like site-specific DNA recombinase